MLFREMVAVYCENQMYVKACGTYKNHCALKG
jgi:hypothetical protein